MSMYEPRGPADERVPHPDVDVITDDEREHMDPRFVIAYQNGSFDGVYGVYIPDERADHSKTIADVPGHDEETMFVTATDISASGAAMLLSHEYLHHTLFEVVGEKAAIALDNVVGHTETIWGEDIEYA